MEVRRQLAGSVLSLHRLDPGVIRLGGKRLYPWSHLIPHLDSILLPSGILSIYLEAGSPLPGNHRSVYTYTYTYTGDGPEKQS